MNARITAALLFLLCLASPALGQDLSGTLAGTWFSHDNAAQLYIAALPEVDFTNDYVVGFYTSMNAAPGICLGEGLARLDAATGELLVTLDDAVTLSILVQHSDAGPVLRIDHDPGPYCGMGATLIGIYEPMPLSVPITAAEDPGSRP